MSQQERDDLIAVFNTAHTYDATIESADQALRDFIQRKIDPLAYEWRQQYLTGVPLKPERATAIETESKELAKQAEVLREKTYEVRRAPNNGGKEYQAVRGKHRWPPEAEYWDRAFWTAVTQGNFGIAIEIAARIKNRGYKQTYSRFYGTNVGYGDKIGKFPADAA